MINLQRVLILMLLAVSSQQAYAIDFLQALDKAEQSDPDILAAEFQYQATLESRPQSLSALLPQINLSVFKTDSSQDISNSVSSLPTLPDGSYDSDTDGFTLTLQQSIYNHSYYAQLHQADSIIASATADIHAARQALILRVAEAYFNTLGAEDNLKFALAEKEAIGQQLEQTQKRFEVGLIAITDVKESQAQYDISVAQAISAENLLATSLEVLRSIINIMPENIAPVTEDLPLSSPEPADIDKWVDTAINNNLSLKSAQYNFEAAQKQVSIDRSGHYPSLNLSAQYNDTSTDSDTSSRDSEDTSLTLQLNVPIYSGGLTNAKTRQAIALKEQARALRDKAQRTAVQLSRESYLGVTTSIAEVNAFKQALISTQTAYEATQAGFEVGTRTAVEVLAALREQYRAERDYARARYTYIINMLRLKQAAGTLSRDDAVQVNQWLQP